MLDGGLDSLERLLRELLWPDISGISQAIEAIRPRLWAAGFMSRGTQERKREILEHGTGHGKWRASRARP